MGKMKKMLSLIERYDRLRKGGFKESMRKEMNELKEIVNYQEIYFSDKYRKGEDGEDGEVDTKDTR